MSKPSRTRREFLSLSGGTPQAGQESNSIGGDQAEATIPESGFPSSIGAGRLLNQLSTTAMGCRFEVFVDAERHPRGPDVALEAFNRIHELDRMLSTYQDQSAICKVNRLAAFVPVLVPPEVLDIVRLAIQIHGDTGGAFDITSGPLSKAWGFYYRKPRVPETRQIDEALARIGCQNVIVGEDGTIRLAKPGVELNLASIGKGYALEQCEKVFRSAEIDDFVIHGGQSSVVARGESHAGCGAWPIGVVHPILQTQRLGVVQLRDRSLATSGNQRQSLIHQGRRLGHVIDPRTGWPATEVLSATVIAQSASITDALATSFCVMNLDEVGDYCGRHPEITAIIVRADPTREAAIDIHTFNLEPSNWSSGQTPTTPPPA